MKRLIIFLILLLLAAIAFSQSCEQQAEAFKLDLTKEADGTIFMRGKTDNIEAILLPGYYDIDVMKQIMRNVLDVNKHIKPGAWQYVSEAGGYSIILTIDECRLVCTYIPKERAMVFLISKKVKVEHVEQ